MKRAFWTVGLLGAAVMLASSAGAQSFIAYDLATPVLGTQNFPSTFGLDFKVNSVITIQALGVFDAATVPGTAHTITDTLVTTIYNRDTQQAVPGLSVTFTAVSPGTLVGGNLFKPVGGLLGVSLVPGNYTLASTGFINANKLGASSDPGFTADTYNEGGGLITIDKAHFRYNENVPAFNGQDKFPLNTLNGQLNTGSLKFAPSTPEPGTVSLFLGLATVGAGAGFRLRRRRAVAPKA
jgi:hypothetical protein